MSEEAVNTYITITKGILILYPQETKVLRSFNIKVHPANDVFIATSDVSDVYELGENETEAVDNYLYSLVDEIIWFHEHKQRLSPFLLKDLESINIYLKLV